MSTDTRPSVTVEDLFQQTIDCYPDNKPQGMWACEQLLSVPGLPAEIEMWTRRNQTWYCNTLSSYGTVTTIDFPHREGWSLFNPSIAINPRGDLRCIVRSSNYRIDESGRYVIPDEDDGAIKTENYFLDMIRAWGGEKDFLWDEPKKLEDGLLTSPRPKYPVTGLEDCRLFSWGDEWCLTATMREKHEHGICQIVFGVLEWSDAEEDLDGDPMEPGWWIWDGPHPPPSHRHEKNWMPFIEHGGPRMIYSVCPTTILGEYGDWSYGDWSRAPFVLRQARGGAAMLLKSGHILAVVHESVTMDPYQKIYTHRFVEIAQDYAHPVVTRISDPFVFEDRQIEFAAGMAQVGDDLVLSYGVRDEEAHLIRIPMDLVMHDLLREPLPEEMS